MNNQSGRSIFFASALAAISLAPSALLASPQQATDPVQAQVFLKEGVEAYKSAQFDAATEDFKRAKQLDPPLTTASLYLAVAYASQYIPGAPAKENVEFARLAVEEYKTILAKDPSNLSAIDGIGGMLFNMAGTPFDPEKMKESKSYHQRHIEIRPGDPEPYYWIGVIDWSISYKTERQIRDDLAKVTPNPPTPADPLPEVARLNFVSTCGGTVDEGIAQLKKAISLKPDYDDALAYLNLLYRLKANMESSPEARDADNRMAEELVDQVKAIKEQRAAGQSQQ
jgi:tetratricopeptide (TPR) repeat protein